VAARSTFDHAALANFESFNHADGGIPIRLLGAQVSQQWFDVFARAADRRLAAQRTAACARRSSWPRPRWRSCFCGRRSLPPQPGQHRARGSGVHDRGRVTRPGDPGARPPARGHARLLPRRCASR
jgi:hypothetical protein